MTAADPNAHLRARLDDVYARYTRMRDSVDELQRRIAELEVRAASTDGTVVVVVGAHGRLRGIRYDEHAYTTHRPDRLAALTAATVQRAQEAAAAAQLDLLRAAVPDEAGLGDMLAAGDMSALLRRHDHAMSQEAE